MKKIFNKKVIHIVLLVIWMLIIFILSHDQGYQSSSKSDPIAKYIVNIISNVTGHDYTGSELNNILDKTIKVVRKSGHIIEYLILGVLSLLVCKDYFILDKKHLIYTILLCYLYSISDEIHQVFVNGRSGEFKDTLIDLVGIILGVIITKYIVDKHTKNNI